MGVTTENDARARRFAPPGGEAGLATSELHPRGESDAEDHYRHLYERVCADLEGARAAVRDLEEAWSQSVERRLAVERALRRLLEATRPRVSDPPRTLIARSRARAALHGIDPLDRN
jgi:hypothetical protein